MLTHGKWGEEIVNSAEMICGMIKDVYTFSLLPEQSIEDYMGNIENLLRGAPKGSIIITDLFGGTTSNVAAVISSKYDVLAISGLDIAMLIAADELRTKYKSEELVDNIISESIKNCRNISKLLIDEQHNRKDEII